jgi:hypothetical protein
MSNYQAIALRAMRLAILCAPFAGLGTAEAADSALQQRIDACHRLADVGARFTCYESLASKQGTVAPSAAIPPLAAAPAAPPAMMAQAPTPPLPPAPAMSSAPAAPIAPAPAMATPPVPARQAPTSLDILHGNSAKIALTVASATMTDDNMLRVKADDGVIWDQTETADVHTWPQEGGVILIKKNFIGGYWCGATERDRYPCKPLHSSIPKE